MFFIPQIQRQWMVLQYDKQATCILHTYMYIQTVNRNFYYSYNIYEMFFFSKQYITFHMFYFGCMKVNGS